MYRDCSGVGDNGMDDENTIVVLRPLFDTTATNDPKQARGRSSKTLFVRTLSGIPVTLRGKIQQSTGLDRVDRRIHLYLGFGCA